MSENKSSVAAAGGGGGGGKIPAFSIGPKASREVRSALSKSKNPAETIANYQMTRSLHSMFAKAFGTTPQYAADDMAIGVESNNNSNTNSNMVESLDTDSVLKFLGHLGVSQYEVHKRIGDALQKQLEDELRKTTNMKPLLQLLQNCWPYATANPEFRPILWGVLKQLGDQTPLAVLQALAERDTKTGKLKHVEIFRPLPPLLKRLVWEADWEDNVPLEKENSPETNPKQYLKLIQSTLLYETVYPSIDSYTSTPLLVDASDKFFVNSTLERKVLTGQRRALTNTTLIATSPSRGGVTSTSTASSLLNKSTATAPSAASSTSSSDGFAQAGKAVSQIRNMLSDTSRGSASYRPRLLHAVLSMLMAQHGVQAAAASTGTSQGLLAGACHLHCTLVADILLSTSGPLPKEYTHVHTLARILDDAVRNGIFTDKDLIKVQETLRLIYSSEPVTEDDTDGNKKKSKTSKGNESDEEYDGDIPKKGSSTTKKLNKSLMRQLNQIIISGLSAMKDSDPQNLFLNPVTDAIAPGYSKVIKKPMSIGTMEKKIENNQYTSIEAWEADVRLMFKNCVDYNRGQSGQWFRGEAKRQLKVFTDEILPQAKNLYKIELQKRNPEEDAADLKRKREEEEKKKPKIEPLDPARKKRKIDIQEYNLSMPAVAAMLLADPFVVRILLDRVLRSIRLDTNKGTGVPCEHLVIPSIMQLLFLAEWSPQICAIRGRQFVISDSGLRIPSTSDAVESMVPYTSLRHCLPTMIHLLRDADLEKRLAPGGDLHTVAQASLPRPEPKLISLDENSPPSQVALALLEGAYVYVCMPGNSHDISLSITFVKFSSVFLELAQGNVWDERSFFKCLVPAILRHKHRLHKTVRDVIISTWIDWLKSNSKPEGAENIRASARKKKKSRQGSIESAAHEYLLVLLNEWAGSFGNLLMPRDLLLKVSTEVVDVVNATEAEPERKLAELWKGGNNTPFWPVKEQYQRLLSLLPENHRIQWKKAAGIEMDELTAENDRNDDKEADKMDVDL